MSLPAYDPLKHHVGLGVDTSTLKGFVLSGAYRRDPQRQGGSTEYGGEGDVLSAGTAARWTQDDFSGGGYQQVFENDPAMFSDAQNFLPNLIERSARTVPPLEYFVDAAVSGQVTGPALPLGVFATGGRQITVVDEDQIRFYDASTGVRTIRTADDPDGDAGIDPGAVIYAATHDPADNLVYAIARRSSAVEPDDQLNGAITASDDELTLDSTSGFATNGVVRCGGETIYYRGKTSTKLQNCLRGREGTDAEAHADNATVTFRRQYYLAKCSQADGFDWIGWIPNSAGEPPRGICVTAGRDVLIQMGTALWLLDVNDARTSLTAVRIGRLPGRWVDAATYNGLTYLLLTDSEQHTSVHAWDGSQVLPVTDVPYNFLGKCLEVYAGRVYVGGAGSDVEDFNRYAELYEVSGASLKLIRTFAAEARAGEIVPRAFFDMTVHEGLLFLGTDIGELVAYDITRDALWPGIQIRDVFSDHNLEARNLLSTREKLFAWCYDTNRVSPVDGFYRMATLDDDVDESYTSILTTSDFLPEPDRQKRWANLRLVTRFDTATLEVSQDGGATWDAVAGAVTESGSLNYADYDLSGLDPSSGIRFRISMASTSVGYAEIIAFTCRFYWLDSGKQAWSMTVLGASDPEAVDGSMIQDYDVAALRSTLWSHWTGRTTLAYRDLDGTDYTVYVSDMSELQPIIADAVDEDGTREAQYSLVLTEI